MIMMEKSILQIWVNKIEQTKWILRLMSACTVCASYVVLSCSSSFDDEIYMKMSTFECCHGNMVLCSRNYTTLSWLKLHGNKILFFIF